MSLLVGQRSAELLRGQHILLRSMCMFFCWLELSLLFIHSRVKDASLIDAVQLRCYYPVAQIHTLSRVPWFQMIMVRM